MTAGIRRVAPAALAGALLLSPAPLYAQTPEGEGCLGRHERWDVEPGTSYIEEPSLHRITCLLVDGVPQWVDTGPAFAAGPPPVSAEAVAAPTAMAHDGTQATPEHERTQPAGGVKMAHLVLVAAVAALTLALGDAAMRRGDSLLIAWLLRRRL